jgi:hypothetical protein
MEVLEDFSFQDPADKVWTTPAGWKIDGASIPRALWTLVGSPYTGDYRRASIVHDKACDDAGSDAAARRAADRMFYRACRAGGCSTFEATILYIGVRIGGLTPVVAEWPSDTDTATLGPRIARTRQEENLEADFRTTADMVMRQGETDDVDEVERRTDQALEAVTGLSTSQLKAAMGRRRWSGSKPRHARRKPK